MKQLSDFIKKRYRVLFQGFFFIGLFANIVFLSGYALTGHHQFRQFTNIYLVICTSLLLVYFVFCLSVFRGDSLKKIGLRFVSNRKTWLLAFLLGVAVISFIVHREFSREGLSTLVVNVCLVLFSFCFSQAIPLGKFIHFYRLIFPILSLASLLVFLPSLFLTQSPYFLPWTSSGGITYNNYFFVVFQIMRSSNRNCGPFWEPGLFAIFLNIGFILEFYGDNSKPKAANLFIYLVCLFTTFSTAGYIVFLLVVLLCISRCRDRAFKKKLIGFFGAAVFLIALALVLIPAVRDKITSGGVSLISRLYGPFVNLQVFNDRLFLGVGSLGESAYFESKVAEMGLSQIIDAQVSTFGYFVTAFGLLGIGIIVCVFIGLFSSKKLKLFEKSILALFVVVVTNAEPLQLNITAYLFLFYSIHSTIPLVTPAPADNLFSTMKSKLLHSNGKNSTLAKNSIGALTVRGLAMLLSLVTTSGYLTYFGDKRILGVWFTILQIIVFILTFDLGIGNGLKNRLIAAMERNDKTEISRLMTSSLLPTFLVSASCVAIGVVVCNLIDFNAVFNVSPDTISPSALRTSMIVIVTSIALQFFLKIVGSVFEALQKQFVSNIFPLITNLAMLVFVNVAVIRGDDTKILAISLFYLIVSNLPYLVGGVILFTTALKGCQIKKAYFDWALSKDVVSLGSKFLLIQLSLLLINSCNSMILAQLYTSEAVPDYAVYQKLFNVVIVVCALFTGPLWAIIAKAKSQKDEMWIRKLASLMKKAALVLVVADVLLTLCLQPVFDILFSNYHITVNWPIAIVFALHSIFMVIISLESCVCNGLEILKPQIFASLLGVAIKIALTTLNFTIPALAQNVDYWYLTQLFSAAALLPSVLIMTLYSSKIIKGLAKHENRDNQ